MDMTMVICHRGDSGRWPENTKLAFCQAVQSGAEGIELDVHLTRDGHVVVIHDERVDRTTNGNGYVKDMTLAQLRRLRITGKGEAQSILTLEEYFAIAAPAGIRTNIELKTGWFAYPGLEEKVWAIVQAYRQENNVLFSSFHVQSLLRMKAVAPEAPCGLLSNDLLTNPEDVVQELGFQAFHPWYLRVSPSLVRRLHARGIAVNVYTPNSPGVLAWLIALGVDSVITDYPRRALLLRKRLQPG